MWEHFSLVQLLTPVFSFLMILTAFSRFRRREQTFRELLLWLLVWGGIGFVGMYPGVLDVLPSVIGIKSGVNALIFFGLVVLFYGVFRLVMEVERLQRQFAELNREIALREERKRQRFPGADEVL